MKPMLTQNCRVNTAQLQDRAPLQAQCHTVLVGLRVQLQDSQLSLDLVASPALQAYVEQLFSLCGDLTARKSYRTMMSL